ncbi:hypothetical protein A6A04_16160 [Paramagnetospirillum marisnigri]|uniref:Uncharacterized protein n=1 Tax=Paramagnetospirillum marisnigri TaxID=1285242 RepID=A0A178MRF6_9PROT|nr:hypothetical protein [Paramagnetospirillum marisnigri]OAN51310.1 hypothetical protein A6A04_16160 [Paramagnetospirillum marisnigri]
MLNNTGTEMADAMGTLAAVIFEVTTRLRDSAYCLKQVNAISSALREQAKRLADTAGEVGPDEEERCGAMLGQLAECYTMARERETHHSQVNGGAFVPHQASAGTFSVDDALF